MAFQRSRMSKWGAIMRRKQANAHPQNKVLNLNKKAVFNEDKMNSGDPNPPTPPNPLNKPPMKKKLSLRSRALLSHVRFINVKRKATSCDCVLEKHNAIVEKMGPLDSYSLALKFLLSYYEEHFMKFERKMDFGDENLSEFKMAEKRFSLSKLRRYMDSKNIHEFLTDVTKKFDPPNTPNSAPKTGWSAVKYDDIVEFVKKEFFIDVESELIQAINQSPEKKKKSFFRILGNDSKNNSDLPVISSQEQLFNDFVEICTDIGVSSQNEDAYVIQTQVEHLYEPQFFRSEKHVNVYGVFDGHGGIGAANYAKTYLIGNILQNVKKSSIIDTSNKEVVKALMMAIPKGFLMTDKNFGSLSKKHNCNSGTTVSLVFVVEDTDDAIRREKKDRMEIQKEVDIVFEEVIKRERIDCDCILCSYYGLNEHHVPPPKNEIVKNIEPSNMRKLQIIIANCGDSSTLIVSNGKIKYYWEHSFHKPSNEKEKKRIEKAGGRVTFFYGKAQVNGVLSVSRSIGDTKHKQYVISEPSVDLLELEVSQKGDKTCSKKSTYLICASDGLWDKIRKKEAMEYVEKHKNDTNVSLTQGLINMAQLKGSKDNVTVLLHFLD